MHGAVNEPGYIDDARWVSATEAQAGPNSYTAFRLVFPCSAESGHESVAVRVSASSLYRLYVNGEYVGRGPVREWKGRAGIDAYDIGPRLRSGRNVISALVHHFGEDVGGYPGARQGFLLQGAADEACLSTGVAAWESLELKCWDPRSPRTSLYVGFNEDVDLAAYRPNLWESGADDAGWKPVSTIENADEHWPHREPRTIPPLRETRLGPLRLLAVGEYDSPQDDFDKRADAMAAERHRRVSGDRVQVQGNPWPIRIEAGGPVYLILDVGRMTSGVLDLDIVADAKGDVRIGYADQCRLAGRSLLEGRDAVSSDPRDNAPVTLNPDHGGANDAVDRLTLTEGLNTWEGAFNLHGFRYVKLSVGTLQGGLTLRSVGVREITYPAEPRGRFRCSDDRLNAIWEAGRLTTLLCMSDTYMDNPSRERQQYGGDGFMQSLYAYAYFGDTDLWRQFLRHFSQGGRADGAMQSAGPWIWDQIIPAWTLLWIESIDRYVQYTGEHGVAAEHADAVHGALDWFTLHEQDEGLLTVQEKWGWGGAPGGVLWNFIDWQGVEGQLRGEEARLVLNCLYYRALDTAARIMKLGGNDRLASHYAEKRRKLRGPLTAILGDLTNAAAQSEQVLAYATGAGLVAGRMGAVAERAGTEQCTTDLFCFFLLEALEREGQDDAVVAFIHNVLGRMLDDGGTTFHEIRQAREIPSRALCQGVGGFPGYWLARSVVGVRDVRLADRTVVFRPHLGYLDWVEATVPCADGDITISLSRDTANSPAAITVPDGWRVLRQQAT